MATSLSTAQPAQRPGTLIAAVVLTVLGALGTFPTLPLIPDDAPSFVLPLVIGVAVLSLALSWWLWQLSKWAAVILFVFTVLNGLAGAPGVFVSDVSMLFRVLATIGVVQTIAVCWLLLHKSTRAALR